MRFKEANMWVKEMVLEMGCIEEDQKFINVLAAASDRAELRVESAGRQK